MKRIWIVLSLIILIFITYIFEILWINNFTANLKNNMYLMENSLLNNNIDDALNISNETLEMWEEINHHLAIFVDHSDIDDISQSIKIVNVCIKTKNIIDSFIEISKAIYILENLLDFEIPSFHNIL